MKTRLIQITGCLGLILWLAACGTSPPNDYYRLTTVDSPSTSGNQPALGIGPVNIPEYLNRSGLVYSEGGNQLTIAERHRWAEPLDQGINRVVAINLADLLDTENLRYYPWGQDDIPEYGVKLNVLELDVIGGEAILVVDWLLYRPGKNDNISRRMSRLTQALPSPMQPSQLAPAYSALFYQLSELIATAIRSAEAP